MIEVELPDGTVLDIDTDDDAVAAAAAQKYLAANAPPTNPAGAVSRVPNGGFLDRLSARYNEEIEGGLSGAAEGIEKMTRPNNTLGGRALGAGQALFGGMQYAAAPLTAPTYAIAEDPVRLGLHQAGAPQAVIDTAGNLAGFAAGMLGGKPVVDAGKAVAREAAPILNALSRTPARTSNQILDASKEAYKRAEMTGAVVKPEAFREFVENTDALLRREGYAPGIHKQVAPVLKELRTAAKADTHKNFEELEKLRRVANQAIMSSTDDANVAMAYKVRNSIDDFTGNVRPHQMQAGNSKEAAAAWKEGRGLYRQQARMKDIEEIMDTASKVEDGDKFLRQQFTRIIKNPDELKTYTKEQQDLIQRIANRGNLESAASYFAPGSGRNLTQVLKSIIGGGIGFGLSGGNPGAAAAVPALSMAAEKFAQARRVGNVNALTESISRGKAPTYMERLAEERATLRALGR